jgi:hypothetical protein
VIARNKIGALRRAQLAQRLGSLHRIDRCAIVQIAGNENHVGLLPHRLGHDPPKKPAVSNVPQVQIAE